LERETLIYLGMDAVIHPACLVPDFAVTDKLLRDGHKGGAGTTGESEFFLAENTTFGSVI